MALAQKPRKTAATRKSHAQHHTQTKHYLKHYYPYLPMLAIVAAGGVLSRDVTSSTSAYLFAPEIVGAPQQTTVVQAMTGIQASWITLAVGVVSLLVFAAFMFRNSYKLHRTLTRGEAFIAHHPVLDIVAVLVFTAGFVLTRDMLV